MHFPMYVAILSCDVSSRAIVIAFDIKYQEWAKIYSISLKLIHLLETFLFIIINNMMKMR